MRKSVCFVPRKERPDKVYCGETGRNLCKRVEEHKLDTCIDLSITLKINILPRVILIRQVICMFPE